MYLMCPRCRSYFEMSVDALGKQGRKVRCAVCSKTWRARQKDLRQTLPPAGESASKTTAHALEATRQSSQPSSSSSSPLSSQPPSPPYGIPPPLQAEGGSAAERVEALTQHHHHAFAPLQFAERSIEDPLNNLLRFAFAWSIWGLFLLAMLFAIRTYPLEILQRFPNAIHFYERLNMSHPDFAKLLLDGRNFSLTQVKVVSEYRLSRDLLVVSVLVGNGSNEEKAAPILRGTFFDGRGEETGYFHFEPEQETLPAQGVLEYSAQVDLPQPTSTTLTLTLLSLFEGRLDLGGTRLKVHNTRAPVVPPSANPSASAPSGERAAVRRAAVTGCLFVRLFVNIFRGLGDAHREMLAIGEQVATRDEVLADFQIDLTFEAFVERDDRTATDLQKVADAQFGSAYLRPNL